MNDRSPKWIGRVLRCLPAVLLSIVFVSAPGRGAAQEPTPNPRFGLVNAYRDPEAARVSGASWEIITLRWDALQPNGPSDWNPDPEIDEWLASARAAGREVVAVVIGTPQWATAGEAGTGVPRGLYLPVSDAGNGWAGFVNRAASYYGSRGINRWVVWRDLDIPTGREDTTWDGSLEEYYQLVKVASLSAKSANPNAMIHLGGVGEFDPNWFSRFLDLALDDPTAPAANYYFDVATLHVYYSPDRVYTLMQNHFFVMDQRGIPLKEVWINETNARPAIDPEVYPADASFREHPRISVEQQAAFIIQSYALSFAANRGARVGVYQLTDDLTADKDQAFGLVREDGSARPAFLAYQLAAQEFNGFVFARRVEEETHPLIEYVRLTFPEKVTHVVWALTDQNATLVIPARSGQATLVDMSGNRWTVEPEGGVYRVVVGGAECNDPAVRCLIGGAPWLLIESIPDAVNSDHPSVIVEPGGEVPTPDPDAAVTPTPPPTNTPTAAPSETPAPTAEAATAEPTTELTAEPTSQPTEVAEVVDSATAAPEVAEPPQRPAINPADVRPGGLSGALPYLLMGLGVLVIGGGAYYFWMGHRRASPPSIEEEALASDALEDITDEAYPEEPSDEDYPEEMSADDSPEEWEDYNTEDPDASESYEEYGDEDYPEDMSDEDDVE